MSANDEGNSLESAGKIFERPSPSLTPDLWRAGRGMCVREKFSLWSKNHCVGCCSPVKRDHQGRHAKNKDKSPSGETEQCESLGTLCCSWCGGNCAPGAASRPLQVLPSHMTRRSRQGHVHHPLCQLRAHSAGRLGGRRPSAIRSKVDGLQTTCCRRSCTCSTEHQETASQLNGLIIIDRLIMKGGGGERGSQERAVTEF